MLILSLRRINQELISIVNLITSSGYVIHKPGIFMAGNYKSIREEILKKLDANLPYIQQSFGIESIGIFGSVSRGEDTADSDIDVLISFSAGQATLSNLVNLGDYLEELFGRKVDLVTERALSSYIRQDVMSEIIRV